MLADPILESPFMFSDVKQGVLAFGGMGSIELVNAWVFSPFFVLFLHFGWAKGAVPMEVVDDDGFGVGIFLFRHKGGAYLKLTSSRDFLKRTTVEAKQKKVKINDTIGKYCQKE